MYILSEYRQVKQHISAGKEEIFCPICGKPMKYYDHCRRVCKSEGGIKEWILIPRYRCSNTSCRRLHRVLPDFLVPYKHYSTETISGVLEETIAPTDEDSEDYPCEMTMTRWKLWLESNRYAIEAILRSVACMSLGFSEKILKTGQSLVDELRNRSDMWLETIIRYTYNIGNVLTPL